MGNAESNVRVRIAIFGGVLLLVVVLALGSTRLTVAQTPTPTLPMKVLPPNPDAGLTDEERMRRHAESRAIFWARFEAWLEDFKKRDIDLRSLPQGPMAVSYGRPPLDLPSAVQTADLIVVATSQSMQFNLNGTDVTLVVERSLKGDAGKQLVIEQSGGPRPDADWTGATLAYAEGAPLLLPGDRAVLFLELSETTNTYYVQAFTGMYWSQAGRVVGLRGNPFRSDIDGQTEEEFVATLAQLVR